MATRRTPNLLGGCVPDSTGRAWFEPFDVAASNDVWKHSVLRLKDPSGGQEHGVYGTLVVPKDYVGSPVVVPYWTVNATSGNFRMRFLYRAVGGDDAESLDQAGSQEGVSVTDAAPSAAFELMQPTIALTAGNLAVDDIVEFYFTRLDDTGTDTMAADALVHALVFQYADA